MGGDGGGGSRLGSAEGSSPHHFFGARSAKPKKGVGDFLDLDPFH